MNKFFAAARGWLWQALAVVGITGLGAALGVYDGTSMERLPVAGQIGLLPGDRVSLGEVGVTH